MTLTGQVVELARGEREEERERGVAGAQLSPWAASGSAFGTTSARIYVHDKQTSTAGQESA